MPGYLELLKRSIWAAKRKYYDPAEQDLNYGSYSGSLSSTWAQVSGS